MPPRLPRGSASSLAHRPGFVAPPLAARKLATLDQLSGGRLALHIIAGGSDADQAKDGDWTDHAARYRRATEYIYDVAADLDRPCFRSTTRANSTGHAATFRDPLPATAAHPDLRRRRFGRRCPGPGPACRCLHAVGRTAQGYRRVHRTGATRGGAAITASRPSAYRRGQSWRLPMARHGTGRVQSSTACCSNRGGCRRHKRQNVGSQRLLRAAEEAESARHVPLDPARRRDGRTGKLDGAGRQPRNRRPGFVRILQAGRHKAVDSRVRSASRRDAIRRGADPAGRELVAQYEAAGRDGTVPHQAGFSVKSS